MRVDYRELDDNKTDDDTAVLKYNYNILYYYTRENIMFIIIIIIIIIIIYVYRGAMCVRYNRIVHTRQRIQQQ